MRFFSSIKAFFKRPKRQRPSRLRAAARRFYSALRIFWLKSWRPARLWYRGQPIIMRYLLKELGKSQALSLLFLYIILLVNNLLVVAEDLLAKQVAWQDVLMLLIYLSPPALGWALPFSALIGTLMVMGRFNSQNEILAMRSVGISSARILRIFISFSVFLAILCFFVVNVMVPWGWGGFSNTYRKIIRGNPHLELESHSVRRLGGALFALGEAEGKTLNNIIIIDTDESGERRAMVARSGQLETIDQADIFSIQLNDLTGIAAPRDFRSVKYSRFTASRALYNLIFSELSPFLDNAGPDSYSLSRLLSETAAERATVKEEKTRLAENLSNSEKRYQEVLDKAGLSQTEEVALALQDLQQAREDSAQSSYIDGNLRNLDIKVYQRFSLPAICIVFCFLAFGLALAAPRHGFGISVGIGALIAACYWLALYLFMALVTRGRMSLLLLFVPDLFFLLLAGALFLRRNKLS